MWDVGCWAERAVDSESRHWQKVVAMRQVLVIDTWL